MGDDLQLIRQSWKINSTKHFQSQGSEAEKLTIFVNIVHRMFSDIGPAYKQCLPIYLWQVRESDKGK